MYEWSGKAAIWERIMRTRVWRVWHMAYNGMCTYYVYHQVRRGMCLRSDLYHW